jgi:hypothetical protein
LGEKEEIMKLRGMNGNASKKKAMAKCSYDPNRS